MNWKILKTTCGCQKDSFINELLMRMVTVGIISWEYMDKNFASSGEISASQKWLKIIHTAFFSFPSCLEGKIIPFINHIIKNSVNEDAKKNIIKYKNSIMINNHLQLAMKNLEMWQRVCEANGINRRKAIGLTAYSEKRK